MWVMLPLSSLVFLFVLFLGNAPDWRISFFRAAVCWGLLLTAATEILSLGRLLSFWPVVTFWGLAGGLLLVLALRSNGIAEWVTRIRLRGLQIRELIFLLPTALLLILLGGISLRSAPNNWDSMTYHLARAAHWMQNCSVAHYPTSITRQLYQSPWAEYAILHTMILSGGDFFVGLVQWGSMLGCLIGVSYLAKRFGAGWRGQLLAVVFLATLPMGVLQSGSTQNDYVVSFWLVALAVLLVEALQAPSSLGNEGLIGAALGLALLTKATAFLFGFGLVGWFLLRSLRGNRKLLLVRIGALILVAATINVGHWWRTGKTFGAPLRPGSAASSDNGYFNTRIGLGTTVSNLVRNAGIHLSTPWPAVNATEEGAIYRFHAALGLDTNDPASTWPDSAFHIGSLSFHEDFAGNTIHFLLVVGLAAAALFRPRKLPRGAFRDYASALVVGGVLFCALLKWQPWHSRLQLPLFVLSAPLAATVWAAVSRNALTHVLAAILLAASLPWAVGNESRPLSGENGIFRTQRADQYFLNQPKVKPAYVQASDYVRTGGFKSMGLILQENDWEYPFWALLKTAPDRGLMIEHVTGFDRAKGIGVIEGRAPEVLLRFGAGYYPVVRCNNSVYQWRWTAGLVTIFVKQPREETDATVGRGGGRN